MHVIKCWNVVVETLGPELSRLEVSHTDQIKELNDITEQVSQFMKRYNGTVKYTEANKKDVIQI